MKILMLTLALATSSMAAITAQDAIFLHHSIGYGMYTVGEIEEQINDHNSNHGANYTITEKYYPDDPYPATNTPYDYWNLWVNNACDDGDPDITCMSGLCAGYDVIIFKHCYPSASILADEATASVSSPVQTIANYKLQYRALRDLLDSYPDNKFILWTLAPSHRLGTTTENAARAREFVNWVKNDWLTEDGKAHPNIYIFDFFGYVAESDPTPDQGQYNCLKYRYEVTHSEDNAHPNNWAYAEVGPLFAEFIINTFEDFRDNQDILVTEINVTGAGGSNTISTNGGTLQLSAEVLPSDATDKTVAWSLENGTGQAIISQSGLVTAVADGTVTATASATDGSGIMGSLLITISEQSGEVTGTSFMENDEEPFTIRINQSEMEIQVDPKMPVRSVKVFTITGSLLHTEEVTGQPVRLNITSLPAGIYVVQLSDFTGKIQAVKVSKP